MVFDSDFKSSDVKISISIRSERWGTLISCHEGEKKGGGVFRGWGVNRKNTVIEFFFAHRYQK